MDPYLLPKKKRLGQHFLHDTYIINQIVHHVAPKSGDSFVEIGPGDGVLTQALLLHASVSAIELDRDLVGYLQEKFADNMRFSIRQADVLSVNYADYTRVKKRWFGNLPYNISTPFLLSLTKINQAMVDGVFMVQYDCLLYTSPSPRD